LRTVDRSDLLADTRYIGIDVAGARQPLTYIVIAADGGLVSRAEGGLDEILALVGAEESSVVAINAPTRPSLGLVQLDDFRKHLGDVHRPGRRLGLRLAEHQLRERGISVGATPEDISTAPAWMHLGFMLFEQLRGLGYEPFPSAGPRQVLETQPHAIFCALLGHAPLPRHTLEGRIQRQLLLFEEGLQIGDPMEFFDEVTRHGVLQGELPLTNVQEPAALDCFAAAFTAMRAARTPTQVSLLGVPEEGLIVLPVPELKSRY
jgi:hypothetical protein